MTREEKQKAIDALKISAPIMAVTQEEFNDYIQTLNKVMDWLEQGPTTKNDLALIHTEGLDEEIRCTMCTNSMKSDRGCDGSCVVNNDMYEAVMDVIEERIQPTTKNDLAVDCISRADLYNEIKGIDHYEETEGIESEGSLITYHTCDWNEVLRAIEDAPSVTPQPCEDAISKLDEHAKETVSHLIKCYEDGCFTNDERVTLAGIAFQARLRFQLNKYKEREDGADEKTSD